MDLAYSLVSHSIICASTEQLQYQYVCAKVLGHTYWKIHIKIHTILLKIYHLHFLSDQGEAYLWGAMSSTCCQPVAMTLLSSCSKASIIMTESTISYTHWSTQKGSSLIPLLLLHEQLWYKRSIHCYLQASCNQQVWQAQWIVALRTQNWECLRPD